MSNLKRYYLDDYGVLIEHPNGEYVLHSDYASLKAEVERLKMEESKLLTLCETYEGDLERLRKAGDAMAEIVNGTYCIDKPSALIAWNAAKEGKQP